MYSAEDNRVERAASEYVEESELEMEGGKNTGQFTTPILVGVAAMVAQNSKVNSAMVQRNPARECKAPKRYDPDIPGREPATANPKKSRARETPLEEVGHAEMENTTEERENIEDSPRSVELEGGKDPKDDFEVQISPLASTVAECDVIQAIREGYAGDKQFSPIIERLDAFPNYKLVDGLLYMKDNDEVTLCVPNCSKDQYNVRKLLIAQAHSMLAHLGFRKTYGYMRESLWWKNMAKDVEAFCRSCTLCAASKPSTQHPYGLLKPLQVPKYPWSQIGMDFVGPLTASQTVYGKFNTICIIADHLTLMTHLIATKQDYTAKDIAEVLWTNMYKLHGFPDVILAFSSSYHLASDGLIERMNWSLGGVIRICVNRAKRNWAIQLPGIEFAINSAHSETTGFSPFKLNYGRLPRPMLVRTNTDLKGVKEHAQLIKYTQMMAHDVIIAQRPVQTIQANKGHRPAPFKEGDLVFVSTKNMAIPEGKSRKLVNKFIGPIKIEQEVVKGTTYRLDLPIELKRRGIKSTFHASLLKPHIPYEDHRFPRHDYQQFISLEGDEEQWTVEKITNHRGRGNRATFEILWQGGEITWEPYKAIKHLEAYKQYLEAQGVTRASKLSVRDSSEDDMPSDNDTEDEIDQELNENLSIQLSCLRVFNTEIRQPNENILSRKLTSTSPYRQRTQGLDHLVNALVRNNNFVNRADLIRAQTEHIRAEDAREQRLWDINRDYGRQPPDYYGQPGPQDNMPVTPSAAPGGATTGESPFGGTSYRTGTEGDLRQYPGLGRTRGRRSESPERHRPPKHPRIRSPARSRSYTRRSGTSYSAAGASRSTRSRHPDDGPESGEGPRVPRGRSPEPSRRYQAGHRQDMQGIEGSGGLTWEASYPFDFIGPSNFGSGDIVDWSESDNILGIPSSQLDEQELRSAAQRSRPSSSQVSTLGHPVGLAPFSAPRPPILDTRLRASAAPSVGDSDMLSVATLPSPETVTGDLPEGVNARAIREP
ncbi:putative ribonuclease H-like protein, partial [Rhizoctonia solani 123E]